MSIADLLRHDVPLETGAVAMYPFDLKSEQRLQLESRFGDGYSLCRREGDKLLVARALCPTSPNDKRVLGQPVAFPKGPVPKDNQVKVFGETEKFLLVGQSGIVCAQTGWGKTVLGFHAAKKVGRKTLVVTTKDDIYSQWLSGAEKFLGLQPHEVGEIRQDKCEVIGTKFVVAMAHSLCIEGKYPDWIVEDFGLVIIDECHRFPAEHFSRVMEMFPARLRLGLTATVSRVDGKETMLYAHVGPVRAKTEQEELVPRVLRFRTGWQCPRTFRTDKRTGQQRVVRLPHEPGKTTHVEKTISIDNERNDFIMSVTLEALKKDRRVVVFSTLVDHLHAMRSRLVKQGFPGSKTGFYVGAVTKAEREEREQAKAKACVFTTFAMCSEGTDVPWWDTYVLAMPRSNVIQSVGRIRREFPGKKVPTVLDFMDEDSPVFSGYASARNKWYAAIGAEVISMNF